MCGVRERGSRKRGRERARERERRGGQVWGSEDREREGGRERQKQYHTYMYNIQVCTYMYMRNCNYVRIPA